MFTSKEPKMKKYVRHKVNGNDFRRCAWAQRERQGTNSVAVELWRHGTPSNNTVQPATEAAASAGEGKLTTANVASGWGRQS